MKHYENFISTPVNQCIGNQIQSQIEDYNFSPLVLLSQDNKNQLIQFIL